MILRIKNSCLVFLFLLLMVPVYSQLHAHQALLDTVNRSGFYRIALTPMHTSYLKTDFSDLRIADESNKQVPYIFNKEPGRGKSRKFFPLKMLENKITDSGNSILVLQNTRVDSISSISLIMKNAAVSRTASLSGSNDGKHWYIISDPLYITHSVSGASNEAVQELNLPRSTYRYFKLEIDNHHNDPYLVLSAGYTKETDEKAGIPDLINPSPVVKQTDSGSNSYIHLIWDQPFQHNKLLIHVTGTAFYDRDLFVYLPRYDSVPDSGPGKVLAEFRLVSGPSPRQLLDIPRIKTSNLYIIIRNGDNPPLKLYEVSTRQKAVDLVAFLEKGKQYRVLLNQSSATLPIYDLEKFRDSLPAVIPLLKINEPIFTGKSFAKENEKTRNWLWPAIIGSILLLSGLSYRLVKDMKHKS